MRVFSLGYIRRHFQGCTGARTLFLIIYQRSARSLTFCPASKIVKSSAFLSKFSFLLQCMISMFLWLLTGLKLWNSISSWILACELCFGEWEFSALKLTERPSGISYLHGLPIKELSRDYFLLFYPLGSVVDSLRLLEKDSFGRLLP